MPITIGSNIASLQAQRRLNESSDALSRVYERLSSGQRINHASDDAAGLAIADSLRADGRVYTQAIRNTNDGLSMLSIADAAMGELSRIVERITELAEQSSNGVYSNTQRRSLDNEAQALRAEYNRISTTTTFNGIELLSSNQTIQIQVGRDGAAESRVGLSLSSLATTVVPNGTFANEQLYSVSGGSGVQSADLNGDGNEDLVFAANADVLLGNGNGTFKAKQVYANPYGGVFGGDSLLGDINGDGAMDFLEPGVNSLIVHLNNGNGTFQAAVSYTNGMQPGALGDVDGDGDVDLVSGDLINITVRLNNGNGTFSASSSFSAVSFYHSLMLGDLNGDGRLDLAATGNGTTSTIDIYLGNGNATFSVASSYTTGYADFSGNFVDVNADGVLDIIGDLTGVVGVLLGNGNGSFKATASYATAGTQSSTSSLRYADISGDGAVDLITVATGNNVVSVLLNNGNGTFKAAASYADSISAHTLALGDFNNDGAIDMALESTSSNNFGLYFGNVSEQGGMTPFSLTTQSSSRSALDSMYALHASLAQRRGEIGAFQSRLSIAAANTDAIRENSLAAESRIRDADIVSEAAAQIRLQILQQVSSSILAQANQQPTLALMLLRT